MLHNPDEEYDSATHHAWEVLRAYGYSLDALNLYLRMFEEDQVILYTFQWQNNTWTGEAQFWVSDEDGGHIVTVDTYDTHEEALAAILRDRLRVPTYDN